MQPPKSLTELDGNPDLGWSAHHSDPVAPPTVATHPNLVVPQTTNTGAMGCIYPSREHRAPDYLT